jgi:cytochrome c
MLWIAIRKARVSEECTVASFQYSEALKKAKLKWTEETLDKWLTDTEKLVPDKDMTFHV